MIDINHHVGKVRRYTSSRQIGKKKDFCTERRKLWRAVQKQEWSSVTNSEESPRLAHLKAFELSTIQVRCWSGQAACQRAKEITAELSARILGSSMLSSLSFIGSDII